jgi:GNAT superfamily N-acetyltransferase
LIEFRVIAVADHSPVVARHFVAIDSLIVTDGYQRRGMGRRLMHAVEQWSADHSIATIELNVYAFNHPAIRLYEELGYHVLSQRLEKKLDW